MRCDRPFQPGFRLAGLCVAWALGTAGAPAAQESAPPVTVTLAQAIDLAARHDPSVVQARGNLRSAGARVRTSWGSFLPQISGSASGGSSFSEGPARTDPITGEIISGNVKTGSASFGLGGSLDLFAGFRRTADLRAARGREDETAAALNDVMAQSALLTSGDFFSALQSAELVRVLVETVGRTEEQLAIAVARLATRAATVQDSLRAVVQLGEARLALVAEEARLAGAEAQLARRLGQPGRVSASDDGTLLVLEAPPDRGALLAEALCRAPSVLRAEAGVRAAEAAVSASKASYWPTLRLSGQYAFSGSDRNAYTFYNNRQISLGLSWPLFNGFQREEQVVQRGAELDAARASAADARRQIEARLTTQFAALDAARQRIDLTVLSVAAARADVLVAVERYRLGSITISELNLSQEGLTRAEQSAVTARFEYLRAKAEIEAILGRPL